MTHPHRARKGIGASDPLTDFQQILCTFHVNFSGPSRGTRFANSQGCAEIFGSNLVASQLSQGSAS